MSVSWYLDPSRMVEINREIRRLERRIAKYNASLGTSLAVLNQWQIVGDELEIEKARALVFDYHEKCFSLVEKFNAFKDILECLKTYHNKS